MGLVKDFNNELALWFNEQGISNLKFVEGEDFCYYQYTHIAQWGVFENSRNDNHFAQFLYEYGLESEVDNFVISLLHEVGHYMTMHYFDKNAWDNDTAAKENVEGDGSIEVDYWYWELPLEFAANMWAIDWANSHPDEVEELTRLCFKWLRRIGNDPDIMQEIYDWLEDVKEGIKVPLCLEGGYEWE